MSNPFASFDPGPSGSRGPWITWGAQSRGFTLRAGQEKTPFDGFERGVVLDIETMKTGWQRTEGTPGVAPEWLWNESLAQFAARPGEDWKQGFSIVCALGEGRTAVWEQAGPSAWTGFLALVPALKAQPAAGALPLVRLTGAREMKFAKGRAVIPILEVIKWVPRPACLMDDDAPTAALAGDAGQSQGAPDTSIDDEVPF